MAKAKAQLKARPSGATTARSAAVPRVGARLVQALGGLRDTLAAGGDPAEVFTARTYDVPDPPPFQPADVRAVRERIGASQAVFAKIMGASPVLVQSWEQGKRVPNAMARRLLATVSAGAADWRKLITAKAGAAKAG